MKITNSSRSDVLQSLEVPDNIIKLLISTNKEDFLIGWELVESMPNCEIIRAYCKGCTNIIPELNDFWDRIGTKYWKYNAKSGLYVFKPHK